MTMQQMLVGMGGPRDDTSLDGIGGYPTFEIRPWANSGYVKGAGDVTWNSGNQVYNVRDQSHIGQWTNQQSNSPSANQSPTYNTSAGVRGWQVYQGNAPTKWLRFSGGSTWFIGGAADHSYMIWLRSPHNNTGDWHVGGQDGTPTWTSGGGHTNATAGMYGVRSSQWERIGHGYDLKFGNATTHLSTGSSWQCIIFTCQSNGQIDLYYDGTLVASSGTNSGMSQANTNFFLGRSWSKGDLSGMGGYVAWNAYWKRELTPSQISTIWNRNKAFFGR